MVLVVGQAQLEQLILHLVQFQWRESMFCLSEVAFEKKLNFSPAKLLYCTMSCKCSSPCFMTHQLTLDSRLLTENTNHLLL